MSITAQARTIAGLLEAERRFLLPYFQRGYAWLEEHAERLFIDLRDVAEGRRTEGAASTKPLTWYPLGNIIVSPTAGSPDAWLADGHQRLITLTILIAILRDLESDAELRRRLDACIFLGDGDATRPRLVTHVDAQDFFARYVQRTLATKEAFKGELSERADSEVNIISNRDALRNMVGKLTDASRSRLARFILDHCIIVENEVESDGIARLLFSTMHGTGLKPTYVDLFKSDVLGVVEVDRREAAQSAWEGVEARLGRDTFDVLLREIATIETRQVPKDAVEDILATSFKLHEPAGAIRFVEQRLDPLGEHLADIMDAEHGSGGLPQPVMRRAQYLGWVRGHDTWRAPALCWLARFGSEGDATAEFFRRLEALAWAEVITPQGPLRRDERYMRLLGEIEADRALKPGSSLDIDAAQRASMREILGGPNFTRRRYKQFLLLRYDAALRGDEAFHKPARATVEHIFPANPPKTSQWSKDFRGGGAGALRQMLGNLALLSTAEQNKAANKDFAEKRQVYAGSRFAVAREVAQFETFGPTRIEERSKAMVELLMRSWRLS